MKKRKMFGFFTSKKTFIASLRIIIPLYATYVLFGFSIFFLFVPLQKKQMMDHKKEMIRELTDSAWSLLSEYNHRIRVGELTPAGARKGAIKRIRNLRYGPEGKDYFWILDMQGIIVMHPHMPDIEGKKTEVKDSSGKKLYAAIIEKAKENGSGYVSYMWQWKDDPEKIVPKISFVKEFSPWEWIIGTGAYLEDIDREIGHIKLRFAKIFTGLLFIVILMSFYITIQVVRIGKKKSLAEKEKHLEELRLKKLMKLSQMSEASLTELTEFALEEAIKLTQSDIGYLAFLNEDETELTMHSWSKGVMEKCNIADKILKYPVRSQYICN